MRFFGTDGIRDVAGEGRLQPGHVMRAGRALARFTLEHAGPGFRVGIGRDPRPSGAGLVEALSAALAEAGGHVLDLGVVPTPVVAWAMGARGLDLGIAVSASHNPATWNGIKPFAPGGRKLSLEEEQRVEAWMEADDGHAAPDAEATPIDGAGLYADATTAFLAPGGGLGLARIVVDLAAGAASTTAPAVLGALAEEVVFLHRAGARPINDACGTEHPEAWLAAIREHGADGGLAFDGDADRVLVADADGGILDGDVALALLVEDLAARGLLEVPVAVSTVMANLGVEERLRPFGVRLERAPVGDRNVAHRMRATDAQVGAEPSGHVVLARDGALIGDGLVAGVRVLQAAARLGRSLAEVRASVPRSPQVLENVRMSRRVPLEEHEALARAVREAEVRLGERGRIVVRYSGTEPLLRIMVEGKDAAEVDETVRRLVAAASSAP